VFLVMSVYLSTRFSAQIPFDANEVGVLDKHGNNYSLEACACGTNLDFSGRFNFSGYYFANRFGVGTRPGVFLSHNVREDRFFFSDGPFNLVFYVPEKAEINEFYFKKLHGRISD